jgi:dihydrofolate synthase/folylpolyglutamate synthase
VTRGGSLRTLDQWLGWLSALSASEIEMGLVRVAEVLDRLDLARPGLVIHVAGTNGKGSCVTMIEAFLLRKGLRVGAYTSPHLRRYNERIRVDGFDCGDDEIIAAFQRVEASRQEVPLTYFEYGTLAALCVFEQQKVDAIVLEIGMGGRLDAVNAIEPDGGIITNVGLDHCEWLGHDVETIGIEKAGILRPGKPFVFGSQAVPRSVLSRAADTGAMLIVAGRDYRSNESRGSATSWAWSGQRAKIENLHLPSLLATAQIDNAAAVLTLLEALGMDDLLQRDTVNEVLGSLSIPGRLQLVNAGREWLLDVAHNADSAIVLAESLERCFPKRRVIAVVGMLSDKDAEAVIAPLASAVDVWIAVTAASARSRPAAELARIVAHQCHKPCLIADDIASALQSAEERAGDTDLTMVYGSFYVVGPALDALYSRTLSGPGHRRADS